MAVDISELYNSSINANYVNVRVVSSPMSFRSLIDNGIATEGDLIFDRDAEPYGVFHTLGETFQFFNRDKYNDYITDLHDKRYVGYLPLPDNEVTEDSSFSHDVSIAGKLYLNNITSTQQLTFNVIGVGENNPPQYTVLTIDADANYNYAPYIDITAETYIDSDELFIKYDDNINPGNPEYASHSIRSILLKHWAEICRKVDTSVYNNHVKLANEHFELLDNNVSDLSTRLHENELADSSLLNHFLDASASWDSSIERLTNDVSVLNDDLSSYKTTTDASIVKITQTITNNFNTLNSSILELNSRADTLADAIVANAVNITTLKDNYDRHVTLYNEFASNTLQSLSNHAADINALKGVDKTHNDRLDTIDKHLETTDASLNVHDISINDLYQHDVEIHDLITSINQETLNIRNEYVTLVDYNANNIAIDNKIASSISSSITTYDASVLRSLSQLLSNTVSLPLYNQFNTVINKALFDLDQRVYTNTLNLQQVTKYDLPLLDASITTRFSNIQSSYDRLIKDISSKLAEYGSKSVLDSNDFKDYQSLIDSSLAIIRQDITRNANGISAVNDILDNTNRILDELIQDVSINELVIAATFNDINKRLLDLSTNVSNYYVTYDYFNTNAPDGGNTGSISDVTNLQNLMIQYKKQLDASINQIDGYVSTIDSISGSALVDLKRQIDELSKKFDQYVSIELLQHILSNITVSSATNVEFLTEDTYANILNPDPTKLYAITDSNGI